MNKISYAVIFSLSSLAIFLFKQNQSLHTELTRLSSEIKHINDESVRINKINEERSKSAQVLINKSKNETRELRNELKSDAADMPTSIIKRLQ